MQPDTPRATFQTPKMNARTRHRSHTSFPRAKIPPHSPFATRITRYNIILAKEWPKTFSAARHCEDASSSSAERTTPLRLEISTEESHPVQDDPVNEGQLINGLVLGSFKLLFVEMRFYAGSIHDSDDAIKAVQGLHVVIHEEWTGASDERLARLIPHIHHKNDYRQHCHVDNTAQHCQLGLCQDSDFAGGP